jgi:hypothetical protein
MAKRVRQTIPPSPIIKPTQILLDESFLLCASGLGCDSVECKDEVDERNIQALTALLTAYLAKIPLVLDDREPSQVIAFYSRQYNLLSRPVRDTLNRWLSGRGRRVTRHRPAKLKQNAIDECNLKLGTLDPLLCQLAIACHGDAPLWTLDSDFWCANQFHPEIKPTCPASALASVR